MNLGLEDYTNRTSEEKNMNIEAAHKSALFKTVIHCVAILIHVFL